MEGNTIPETIDNTIQREGEISRERGTPQHLHKTANKEGCILDIGLLERSFLTGLVNI